ncbi:hypothetical protein JOB18_031985 [Solea senegalensis]|uniref:Uncharacterized protein n=1 Tax=Solea senegalensis TaxID=28829 RepID=A0AAV6QUL4_SOLSE|nr:hypothetical protein JOB18_031985 [Solea senegalensis]
MNVKHILCAVALTLVLFCQGGQSDSGYGHAVMYDDHEEHDDGGSVFGAASALHVSHVSAVGVLLLSLYALIHA